MKILYKNVDKTSNDSTYILENKDKPEIESGNILVEVKACCTICVDNKVLRELLRKSSQRPLVPASVELSGIVTDVGDDVKTVQPGDRVAGLIPITSDRSGCAEYCLMGQYDVVKIPESVDYVTIASSLGDGLKAYTTLQYLARITGGDVVLVFDGGSPWGMITVQLAVLWGAKVITTVMTLEEQSLLENLTLAPDQVINLGGSTSPLVNHVLEETGGLGVDVVIDNGVRLFGQDDRRSYLTVDTKSYMPSKHDIISVLGINGRWVTSHPQLQLDPPNSEQLYLRGASVNFLFPSMWLLCPSKQGRLQHILQDFVNKISSGDLKTLPATCVSFSDVVNSIDEDETLLRPSIVIKMS